MYKKVRNIKIWRFPRHFIISIKTITQFKEIRCNDSNGRKSLEKTQ